MNNNCQAMDIIHGSYHTKVTFAKKAYGNNEGAGAEFKRTKQQFN